MNQSNLEGLRALAARNEADRREARAIVAANRRETYTVAGVRYCGACGCCDCPTANPTAAYWPRCPATPEFAGI